MEQEMTMAVPGSFNDTAPAAEIDYPKPDRLLSGNPKRTTWNRYARNGVFMGEWGCEAGKWRIEFGADEHEFFQVISGRCRVADSNGRSREYGPGDACMLAPGFSGTFEVLESMLKRYVIVDRSA
jgi:uncharacterized cupin superfamily protein